MKLVNIKLTNNLSRGNCFNTTKNLKVRVSNDLCRSLVFTDIPLYKLKNEIFREFLEKCTQHTIPDESPLRKTCAIYHKTVTEGKR